MYATHNTNKSFEFHDFDCAHNPFNAEPIIYRWSTLIIPSIPHYTLLSERVCTKNSIAPSHNRAHFITSPRYKYNSSARYCLTIMIIKSVTCHQQSNHSIRQLHYTHTALCRITLWKAIHSLFLVLPKDSLSIQTTNLWSWLKFGRYEIFMDYSAQFILSRAARLNAWSKRSSQCFSIYNSYDDRRHCNMFIYHTLYT